MGQHTCHRLKHRKHSVTSKQATIKNKVSMENLPDVVNSQGGCDEMIGKQILVSILRIRMGRFYFRIRGKKQYQRRRSGRNLKKMLILAKVQQGVDARKGRRGLGRNTALFYFAVIIGGAISLIQQLNAYKIAAGISKED